MNKRAPLIDAALSRRLGAVAYASGHGATPDHLGLSLLYYTIPYGLRARLCVCLGSGGGLAPALMRQAQLDLGLIGARTILVDAILVEAGYGTPEIERGWMSNQGVLKTEYPDLWIMTSLTSVAAKEFFSRWGRKIDYLHIDADHSTEGVLADFEQYAPLLSPQATVTFHDIRMESVERALDIIAANSNDFTTLRFPDVGQGIAVLRPKLDRKAVVRAGRYLKELESGEIINCSVDDANEDQMWDYLKETPLFTRHVIAAWQLGAQRTIIEVGGYVTPIAPYLSPVPSEYLLIDPLCEPGEESALQDQPCRVRRMAVDLDAFDQGALTPGAYAVVFLGMQIDTSAKGARECVATVEKLLTLLSGSSRAVLEFPPSWTSCKLLFDIIVSELRPKIEFEVTLDLSHTPFGNVSVAPEPDRLLRRLFVLSGFGRYETSVHIRENIARALYDQAGPKLLRGAYFTPIPGAISLDELAVYNGAKATVDGESIAVRTLPKRWYYAASVPFSAALKSKSAFVVELNVQMQEGVMYAALCNDDLTEVSEQKRLSSTSPTVRLEATNPSEHTRLLIRTGEDDASAVGTIVSAKVLA